MIYHILLILILASTALYISIKKLQKILFDRREGDEIFKYLENIIELQKELIVKMQKETNADNLKEADIIYNIIKDNEEKYDKIRPKLIKHLWDTNNRLSWKIRFELPTFYTIENKKADL